MSQLSSVDWNKVTVPVLPEGVKPAEPRARCIFPRCAIEHKSAESEQCWRCGCRGRVICPEWKAVSGETGALSPFVKGEGASEWCCPLCAFAVGSGEDPEGDRTTKASAEEKVSAAATEVAEAFSVPFPNTHHSPQAPAEPKGPPWGFLTQNFRIRHVPGISTMSQISTIGSRKPKNLGGRC